MKTIIKTTLPFLLIFALFSACTKEKQIDIFILLNRFNGFSETLRADEKSICLFDSGDDPRYSVPVDRNGAGYGLLTAYPDEQGNLKSAGLTAAGGDDDNEPMQWLVCSFTGLDKTEAYDLIMELTENPVKGKIRYKQTAKYRFAYTVNDPGYYFSVEDKKYISTENADFTLRQTTSLKASQ